MKKVFRLKDLDCANCAAKMEAAIRKINGVESVTVNFMTQRLTLEANEADWNSIVEETITCIRKVEPYCTLMR